MADFESTSLRYEASLNSSLDHFRTLLSSSSSRSWKPLQASSSTLSRSDSYSAKGKGKELQHGISSVDLAQVVVHKKSEKAADVIRATTDINVGEELDLDAFKAVLQTPEVRSEWDKLVEHAHNIELLDPQTRISKTDYRLGWPASPRDTITISKTFSDPTSIIDISTSLPRTPEEEPAFLRPAPPYVRSHVHLLAWCVQLIPNTTMSPNPDASSSLSSNKLRLTIFWQWSLKGAVFATHHQQIANLLSGFVDFVRDKGGLIPTVTGWGRGVEMSGTTFERGQEIRNVEYSIVDSGADLTEGKEIGLDELERRRERQRLERSVEIELGGKEGWDVRVAAKGIGGEGVDVSWTSVAETTVGGGRTTIRLVHAKLAKPDQLVRVSVSVQRLAGGKIVKVNGDQVKIVFIDPRDPSSSARAILDSAATNETDDTASIAGTTKPGSVASTSSDGPPSGSPNSSAFATSTTTGRQPHPPPTVASSIASLLRRNYIYFTSLLQEPEAKWRPVSDSRGVTVTQLNSIDPTLTIYRAEATFVGVGVWDVFSTICNPGARMTWDKTLEDATLLEDVDELSELWWLKTKAAWPVVARDSVTLRTVYKSPSSVHIFSFSTDDSSLFPSIPPLYAPTIRTQTDLYGWAIEALSPTTTQITLLDQSDPKGWSNKSWTPTMMVNALAGVGEYSIRNGGPPVVTRLAGAKKVSSRYDGEKSVLKMEYRRDVDADELGPSGVEPTTTIECEIRCDCSTWASSIDIVVDPPPAKVSCLLRHRLSSGGGLWITIEHDAVKLAGDERVMVMVRKGTGGAREKGSVTINGAKAKVDVESLPEDEVKLLSKRKRMKASPIPLDQYSTHGPRTWRTVSGAGGALATVATMSGRNSPAPTPDDLATNPLDDPSATSSQSLPTLSSSTAQPSPLSQPPTTNTSASSSSVASPAAEPSTPIEPVKPALQPPEAALEALSWLQTFHAEQGPELTDPAPGWAIVSDRSGTVVRKKIIPRVSEVLPVYRGDRIVQGLTAEEMASVVSAVGCRKAWDDRVETALPLSTYGQGITTSVLTTKPTFPFKGRIFHLASVNAQVCVPSASSTSSTSTVLFCASASHRPDSTFDSAKLNPTSLLEGQVLLEGWILETLDPYTSSMLAIPSTRCTYVACVDHSGSVPLALNSVLNANLARLIANVEGLGKGKGPLPRVWSPEATLQIEGPLSDDQDQDCVWKLGRRSATEVASGSTLLLSDFEVEDRTFRSLFKVDGAGLKENAGKNGKGLLVPSLPVGSILESKLPRSASLNFAAPAVTAAPSLLQKSTATSATTAPNGTTTTTLPASGLVDLARKSSRSSLRSLPVSANATPIRSKSPPVDHDLVVAELVVDLKHFPHGYSLVASSSFISSAEPIEPLSIEPLRSLAARQVPLRATAHDAPLPSILSASLDSWKRANHLVRILIPTSSITHPTQDPSSRDGQTKPTKPEWYKKLVEVGALVDVRIVPLPEEAGAVGGLVPTEKKTEGRSRVMFNGEKVEVKTQKESRDVLAGLEDEDAPSRAVKISRVPRKRKPTASSATAASAATIELESVPSPLPEELQQPIAVAVRLLAPKVETPTFDDMEFPDPKSPGMMTPADEEGARSPVAGHKMGATPAASRRDTASSDSAPSGPLLGILGAYPLSRLSSGLTTTTATTNNPTATARRTFTLSFVLIVAIISFLLGSLLRSLLTPADYIIYRPAEAEGQQVERALMQAFDPDRRWREARRLLEIRFFPWFSRYDFIIAAVRRD